MPSVSVLMPVRDAQGSVMEAVASIQAQSLHDWELVLVDDGSQDATPALLEDACKKDPRLHRIRIPASGIVQALNTGLAACRAPLIARMDADDLMHPQRLALQLRHLQENPDVGLASCRVRYQGNGAGYADHVHWINTLMSPQSMSLRRFVEAPVAHPSVMFRKSLVELHGGWRQGAFPEDYELWLRWLEAGIRFAKLPEELLTWNDPPGRLSRTDPRYSTEAFYELKNRHLARWLQSQVGGHRGLWLWGSGRITRRRFDALEDLGLRFTGFIDVNPAKRGRRINGRTVRLPDELPGMDESFIVAGVGARGARENIHTHLTERGWVEGRDFLLAA